jgi:hypothetical protein
VLQRELLLVGLCKAQPNTKEAALDAALYFLALWEARERIVASIFR